MASCLYNYIYIYILLVASTNNCKLVMQPAHAPFKKTHRREEGGEKGSSWKKGIQVRGEMIEKEVQTNNREVIEKEVLAKIVVYFPHLDRISKPITVKHEAATMATTSANAQTRSGKLKYLWTLLRPWSIKGANAAAPATRNGLVTLLPAHIISTIPKRA